MADEWNEVKERPKKQFKHFDNEEEEKKDAPKKRKWGPKGGNSWAEDAETAPRPHFESDQGAQAVANWEGNPDDNEIKYELISHVCAQAIQKARLEKKLTQAQLAKAVNEKPAVIIEMEAGKARYDASVINRIEQALSVQIPRGRQKKKPAKK